MAKRTIIFILLLALTLGIAAPAAASTAPAGELSYELTVPAGREAAADHLRDDDYRTRFTLTAGQRLSLSWKVVRREAVVQPGLRRHHPLFQRG